MHRRSLASAVQRQSRVGQLVGAEKLEIVSPKTITEHWPSGVVKNDQMTASFDVLHRHMHHRAAVAIVAALEDVDADDNEIESTFELKCDCVVGTDIGDVFGVASESVDHRLVVAEVQH